MYIFDYILMKTKEKKDSNDETEVIGILIYENRSVSLRLSKIKKRD